MARKKKANMPLKRSEKHTHAATANTLKQKKTSIPRWVLPLILITTFLAFLPVLNAGFVNWDDPDYVGENNILIRDISRLPQLLTISVQGNHHPLTMLSLAINYMISGEEAWSYHLFNLLFHLVNCLLVFRLVFLLTNRNVIIAFTTAILFGIHPMHVESVAWVSERKDVLYGLFFLAGLISYTKYVDTNSKKQYWLTLLFLVLSLLSKPAAVIFPAVLFCIDILRKRKFSFKLITEKIVFFLPAIAMGILTLLAQKEVGAIAGEKFGLAKNILFGFYGVMMYGIKLILPFNLSPFYPFPPINEKLPLPYYIAPFFMLTLVALFFFFYKRNRLLSFAIIFYLINLALVLQVFTVGSAVIAERYTYISYIGLFIIAGWFFDRYAKGNIIKASYLIIPTTIFFAVLTFRQAKIWESGATLWDQAIKSQPSSRAYSARATLFRKEKNYDKAIEYYTKAVGINMADHESYNNRGNIYMDLNKFDLAYADYKNALAIKPDYYVVYDNLGSLLARKNQFDSALLYLNKAIELKPGYKPPYSNRALTLMSLQRYEEAIRDWEKFLQFEPNAADVYNTIGSCFRMLGKNQESVVSINKAIQMNPQQPAFFLNRSYSYFALNNIDQARKDALTAKQMGLNADAEYSGKLGL